MTHIKQICFISSRLFWQHGRSLLAAFCAVSSVDCTDLLQDGIEEAVTEDWLYLKRNSRSSYNGNKLT